MPYGIGPAVGALAPPSIAAALAPPSIAAALAGTPLSQPATDKGSESDGAARASSIHVHEYIDAAVNAIGMGHKQLARRNGFLEKRSRHTAGEASTDTTGTTSGRANGRAGTSSLALKPSQEHKPRPGRHWQQQEEQALARAARSSLKQSQTSSVVFGTEVTAPAGQAQGRTGPSGRE